MDYEGREWEGMVEAWLLFTSIEKVAEEILCLKKRVMVYNQSGKGPGEAHPTNRQERKKIWLFYV